MTQNATRPKLGQHFLTDVTVLKKILDAAKLSRADTVLEIGPGRGALTEALARVAGTVIAVEKDEALASELEVKLRHNHLTNITVVRGDILKTPLEKLELGNHYIVVANIPYYLTSRLIRILLETKTPPQKIILMVQREVAERIVAEPPRMNLLALAAQAHAMCKILFRVPKTAFFPPPNVDSAVIELVVRKKSFFESEGIDAKSFFSIARQAFSGKRKMLRHSLKKIPEITPDSSLKTLHELRVDEKRPQELSLQDWANISKKLAQ